MIESDRDTLIIITCAIITGASIYHLTNIDILSASQTEVQQVSVEENTLNLHTGCHKLQMTISQEQAESINIAIENQNFHRPLTHDLTTKLVENSGQEFENIIIHSIEQSSYKADIQLSNGEKVDSRPSDAIALAKRTDTPVYINRGLLNQADFKCEHIA